MNSLYRKRGVISALLSYMLFLTLSGCGSLFPQVARATIARSEQPIISPYQPFRIVQLCLDTPPLYPARYVREVTLAIADSIDSAVTVNQGGLLVFVSYINHDSYQNSAIQFLVPAFPADPVSPPPPKLGDDPYANAQLQSESYIQDSIRTENRL